VLATLDLDRLLLVVANDPWQKSPLRHVTPAADRLALTEALAEGIPGAEASGLEIDRGGPSYTVMTVEQIRHDASAAGLPAPELYLVVGADLVPELDTWERAGDLQRLVTLAVVSRPTPWRTHPPVPPGWRSLSVDGPQVDVSSSEVRAALARGEAIDDLVPAEVVRCIRRRTLYAVGR
jgi:nicotinate-nucleotide adenylyltransferase